MRVLRGGTGGGRVAVPVESALRTLADGVRGLPGACGVRVRMAGTAARPRVVMTVRHDREVEPAVLYAALEKGPAARCRTELKMPDLPVIVRFESI